jgi:hypothetical protein
MMTIALMLMSFIGHFISSKMRRDR